MDATMPATDSGELYAALTGAVADSQTVRMRAIDRYAMAADASHFQMIPRAVVYAQDAAEVGRLLRASAAVGTPLTLRSGGTSLSGQSVTDGILVDVRRHFRDVEVLDHGRRVRVQPGLTLAQVNARLRRFATRLGPDPASETACTVGGVIANNSSGMACGITENTYRTLESMVLVLPSGTVVDSGAADADDRLRAVEPELYRGIASLRDRVRADPASTATIAAQYSMKNTMGYGLNAFVDHDDPVEILAHLVIGSEGTLGFVAEATFRTVPLRKHVTSTLAVFDSLAAANRALPALVESGAATLELMDATSLRVGQALPDRPAVLDELEVDRHAALLVEYQATDPDQLTELQSVGDRVLASLPLHLPAVLSQDGTQRTKLWKLRKGLYASVAGARPSGTTALLEDVVVPVAQLARTCEGLIALFDKHRYSNCVIFGHAKDGNIHFMLTDRFETPEQLGRYEAFTEDMVELILGQGGSLKAEHGTGRVMAPYVRRQFGDELYDVMRQVKRLCDPDGMLNPGVILDEDPTAHLRHIKLSPEVEEEVDRCVECGYCEPVCPSQGLTTTPRQRIVVRRAMAQAAADGDSQLVAELTDDYDYDAIQTCAADGMCATACPVLINTGDLMKRLRAESRSGIGRRGWKSAAKHWSTATGAGALGLSAAQRAPELLATGASVAGRLVFGEETVPRWSADLPGGGSRRSRVADAASGLGARATTADGATGEASSDATGGVAGESSGDQAPPGSGAGVVDAIYLPSCVNAMFGPAAGSDGVQRSLQRLCDRAGLRLLVPEQIDQLCCGTPWTSKGYTSGAEVMQRRVAAVVRDAVDVAGPGVPVISDASSCTEGFAGFLDGVEVIDVVDFVARRVLPLLPPITRVESVMLHPTCSSTQLGSNEALGALGDAIAGKVVVPADWGCCAFAGDRGMLHPELTESATEAQAAQIRSERATTHASCNRTCEIGMTRATGMTYVHIVELLERASRGAATWLPDR